MIFRSRASRVALVAALGTALSLTGLPAVMAGEEIEEPAQSAAADPVAEGSATASLRQPDKVEPADETAIVAGSIPPPSEPAPVDIAGIAPPPPAEVPAAPAPDLAEMMRGLPDPAVTAEISKLAESFAWPQRLPEGDRRQIITFYAQRNGAPLWLGGKTFSADAARVAVLLSQAGDHGLNPRDYAVSLPGNEAAPALAEAELRLTASAVLYARDARGGRLDPRRLSAMLTPKLDLPEAREVIDRMAAAADPAEALETFQPRHTGYERLKGRLAGIRQGRPAIDTEVRIPSGPPLRIGMRDERIPLIRARLQLEPAETPVYDRPLANAVAEFQRQAGLAATGVVSQATIEAMQAPRVARLEADLISNMERWRWLPAELGESHVFVSIPEYRVQFQREGTVVHDGRAIVGKPDSPTPVFSDQMDHLVMNPSWFIPPSIMKKDILPGLARDPDYAAKRGYQVIRRGNQVTVRQPPGERNALGHVKFMFPNAHAVYLHDTPGRHLFARDKRALSHGCVRVEQPLRLASAILTQGLGPEWSESRLRGMVGFGERMLKLNQKVPVHLTYFTHQVDEAGQLQTFEDIYGYNRLVRQALGFRG